MNKEISPDMSVEEILKSIKSVISDRVNTPYLSEEVQDEDILELTEIAGEKEPGVTDLNLEQESLISQKSAAEAKDALMKLVKTTQNGLNNSQESKQKIIEEWVIEMLRPQLKQWLDNNLTPIVQKLIEKEIQKLLPDNLKKN